MAYLELKNVSKTFGSGSRETRVLHDINLEVQEGEFVAIVGFSGSGKTTLINLISGLEQVSTGSIRFKGKNVEGTSHERGVIFQNYSLLPWLNVYQNIKVAVRETFPNQGKSFYDERVRDYIEKVNLSPAIHKKPKELSGGMRQRVAVARALAMDPEMILMDEPLGALDALTRGNLQDEILRIWEKDKRTAILITNDVDEGIYMADRIIPLLPGPNATLGPEFKIDIERPRDKTELNDHPRYKQIRNELISFLMQLGSEQKASSKETYTLPDLQPKDLRWDFRSKIFAKS